MLYLFLQKRMNVAKIIGTQIERRPGDISRRLHMNNHGRHLQGKSGGTIGL